MLGAMAETTYRNRRAYQLDNGTLRLTVLVEGGHVAEIFDHATGINPLWTPPWPSIEPSRYDPALHPEYGQNAESKLLAGIMGHNLCLDIFGPPSEEEAAAGLPVHGEASVVPYRIEAVGDELRAEAELPEARLRVQRRIRLAPGARVVEFTEIVQNVSATDRPAGWTQHVTLGPPFLAKGETLFRVTATRSKVFESDFSPGASRLQIGAEFDWPWAPRRDGSREDLRVFTNAPASGEFTTHLMDPAREHAWFVAWSPAAQLAFGYVWHREDFPWMGIWEENYSRSSPPWNGQTLTRGMEFGVSPMPETRRQMIGRG
ncbi:MAG: hypothetical protein ACPL88_05900, partial [Bryobacteraceae bacterium]